MIGVLLIAAAAAGGLPDDFVYLRDVAPAVVQDIRYAGVYNFTGSPVPGYDAAECVLTSKAAEALKAIDAELATQGLGLVVWDCYRPARAVAAFMAWTRSGPDTMKPVFYPNENRSNLVARDYIAEKSGHSGGSVVDLGLAPRGYVPRLRESLIACTGPQDDGLPDMGTAYDCFDPQSALTAEVSLDASANRALLRGVMERHGFAPYQAEWWHFRLIDQPHEGAIFDAPVSPRR
ncbi:MAG: M15 family metallopeptidase [Micropepsaceae bacterium]